MGEAGGIIEDSIRALSYVLSEIIYDLIIWMYNIFERLCNSRILDSNILEVISERVGVILGLIMLFMVVFSVIQMILEPDKLTDKEKGIGNIAKKIILVVVMLGVSNSAFRILYGIQKNIIDSNVIQKFLLPYEIKEEVDFGGVLSSNLFTSFYHLGDITTNVAESDFSSLDDNELMCVNKFNQLKDDIANKKGFSIGKDCVNLITTRGATKEYIMSFNWLILPIVGLVVFYFVFSYCLSVGMRTIQLAFLEIISPMAIVSYLSPKKDTMFQKWTKLYFSTYIDVFLRIMIINLVAFLIATLFEHSSEWFFWNSVDGKAGNFSDTVILVLMVMALLMFAKKAPELLKDLFPSGGSKLGLGAIAPKKIFDNMLGGNFVKGAAKLAPAAAITGVAGAAISGISRYNAQKRLNRDEKTGKWQDGGRRKAFLGMLGGVGSGFVHGTQGGMKKGNLLKNISGVVDERVKSDNDYVSLINAGGSITGRGVAKFVDKFGESRGQADKRKLENADFVKKSVDNIEKLAESTSHFRTLDHLRGHLEREPGETEANYLRRIQLINEQMDNYKEAFVQAALRGEDLVDYQYKTMEMQTKKVKVGEKAKMVTEDVFEVREVDTGIFNPDTGKNFTRQEKVKVGTREVASTTEFEDVFEDRVEWVEISHDTADEASTVILTGGDKTKAAQIVTDLSNLRNEVTTRNITLVDSSGNVGIPDIPDVTDPNVVIADGTAKKILGLAKDVRRTESTIKRETGYMAGQANMPNKKGN